MKAYPLSIDVNAVGKCIKIHTQADMKMTVPKLN